MIKPYLQPRTEEAVGIGANIGTPDAALISNDMVGLDASAIVHREAALEQIIGEVHRDVVRGTVPEMARELQSALSTQLVAYMTGQSDRTIQRWARGDVQDIRHTGRRRLITAYEILRLIDHFERPEVARTWFISNEPQLDYTMPAEAIRNDQLEDALAAARYFVAVG